jgi:hypothetical protein
MSAVVFGSVAPDPRARAVLVPAHVTAKADLLAVLADGLRFPGWFGWNWDALLDMLRDLTWLEDEEVRIIHEGLPDDLSETWTVYLKIATAAIDSRNDAVERGFPDAPRLLVIFPSSAAVRIITAR